MERISIFNYEVFYLDYLEGRLGEEDTRMLMKFFEEHPECKLEDTELPTLSDAEELTFKGKSDLKQFDDDEAITILNADHFMISEAEGLLSNEKKSELNQLVDGNPELENDRKRYAAVYFAPDEAMVYANKEELKRKKTLVLWPYVSGAVAAAIVGFIFMTGGGTDSVGQIDFNFPSGPRTAEKPIVIPATNNNESPKDESPAKSYNATYSIEDGVSTPDRGTIVMTPIERKPGVPLKPGTSFDTKVLKPIGVVPLPSPKETSNPETYLAVHENSKMENPIEPITNFITKKTKTEVDFGRKKRSRKEKGGFFFKIGNFEISKNKN